MVVFLLEPVLGKAGKVNQINRAVTIGRWSDIPDENGIGLQPVINQDAKSSISTIPSWLKSHNL